MNREAHVDKDDDDAIGNINNQQFRLNRGSIVKWLRELLLFCVIWFIVVETVSFECLALLKNCAHLRLSTT